MPRRKGHGIPPTKRVKPPDAIARSAPLKNKLYNDIPVVTAKEETLQMTVNAVPIKSDPPSIISEALHSKYLHKKFKKMASTLLPEENNQLNNLLNGRIKSRAPSEEAMPKADTPPISNARVISPPAGRYVCSYCKLACAKPSVLQKHIRAHTNERPYPCLPCGFAFKTKSNLYKHCRSRAHATKLEETGEKPPPICESEEFSSDEDGSLSGISNAASGTSRAETDPESKDDMPKSIYKPKYRFMEPSAFQQNEKSDEKKENALSPPRLHLKIPVLNSSSVISTPSPFTSGSSPSPEFLQRHISKLISENQAIVETNDPFWSKKFLQRTNSSDNSSPSPLSTSPSPADVYPVKKAFKQSAGLESAEEANCDKLSPRHSSKLALALLRPQAPDTSKFPLSETYDAQPLNLSTGSKDDLYQQNRKRSYSESIPEKCSKLLKDKLNNTTFSHQIHNNLVQDDRQFPSSLHENSAFVFQNHLDVKRELSQVSNSQNPEGSIIKDLLLKSRAAASPCQNSLSPSSMETASIKTPGSDERAYSPSSQFMCHLCNEVRFRDADSLETHQVYHCMGSDISSRSSLGSHSPHRDPHPIRSSIRKSGPRNSSVMIATPYPSPGPLLGNTPLVDSYRTKSPISVDLEPNLLKKRKFDSKPLETRVISATTLRSLEELSKCPMRSNVHMFGGEVKILDTPGGEMKTLRIDSNKNSKTQSETISHSGKRPMKDLSDVPDSKMVVTFSKQGLHSGGGIVQVPQQPSISEQAPRPVALPRSKLSASPGSIYQDSSTPQSTITHNLITGLPTPVQIPLNTVPSILPETPVINPLTNITAYNPLTLPPASMLPQMSPGLSTYPNGIFTIFHGGKEIPHVPGMPGPHSLLPNPSVPLYTSVDSEKKFFKSSESKLNNQNDQYSRAIKSEKGGQSVTQKTFPLNIPTIQVNNEMMSCPGEQNRAATNNRKRSIDESGVTRRNHLLSLPAEADKSVEASLEKRFLRPSSLPLKPGTFVPKRQQSTPVLSLVSPETPRPRKSYGQLYLNGHAYTYLGLKCSTRMFFCTLNKPQPIYVPLSPDHNKISMYSNWKVCTEADPNPCGLDPGRAMTLYDSRHRPATYTLAQSRNCEVVTHSTYWTSRQAAANPSSSSEKEESAEAVPKRVKIFAGGFESNEDYIYVRGRGRGRYVCEECGIRCKKPSMLKKHIRTHTDVRPFTCIHCKFSFKTKGNLTKHMKSKAHFKKCTDLGITPVPTIVDDSYVDEEALAHQQALRENQGIDPEETDDEEDDEDEDSDEEEDLEDESEDCLEREAAQSLLTLSETIQTATQRQQASAGLVAVSARPSTYPYSYSQMGPEQPTDKMEFLSTSVEERVPEQEIVVATDVSQAAVCEAEETNTPQFYFSSQSHEQREPATTPQSPTPVSGKHPTPIDLSHKPIEKSTRTCDAAMLLATLCSTMERLPIATTTTAVSEDSTLLQAYLTERAVQDSRMKRQQYKQRPAVELTEAANTSPTKDATLGMQYKPRGPELAEGNVSAAKENALGILAQTSSDARKHANEPTAATGANKPQAEFLPPSSGPPPNYVSVLEDGRSMCNICNKVFSKPSQLRLHVNIHYFERPYRCESCAVSFRTKGHLQKHQRSVSHLNKVSMNSTFGTATTANPRPFKCDDCKIAFRIHGHLAKHLRSKMHIMKLECLGKLPFGTYAEMERSGVNMNEIDTTDCENSLESLQLLARKLYDKDPSKLGQWDPAEMMPHPISADDTSSEGEDEDSPATQEQLIAMQRPTPYPAPRPTTGYSATPEPHKGPRHKPVPAEPRRTDRLSDV